MIVISFYIITVCFLYSPYEPVKARTGTPPDREEADAVSMGFYAYGVRLPGGDYRINVQFQLGSPRKGEVVSFTHILYSFDPVAVKLRVLFYFNFLFGIRYRIQLP